MSLKHALLGFLNFAPMTGYELKKYFDISVNHFWSAELSQIYPTLGKMAEDGLLTCELKYQADAPNSKIYHLTEAGREELLRWLKEPAELIRHREVFLIKVFFGANLSDAELVGQLQDQLRRHKERLGIYQAILDQAGVTHMTHKWLGRREALCQIATLRAGILNEEAWIKWCDETIVNIQKGAMSDE